MPIAPVLSTLQSPATGSQQAIFEWYVGHSSLRDILDQVMDTPSRHALLSPHRCGATTPPVADQVMDPSMEILHVGSGNSKLPEDLWRRGYLKQVVAANAARRIWGNDFRETRRVMRA